MKKIFFSLVVSLSLFASSGEELVKQNGCMECHNIMGKKKAPPFLGIANRNLRFYGTNAKESIKHSIKNGSNGKYRFFVGEKMPAYSYLSDGDVDKIATWILEKFEENKDMFMKKHRNKKGCNN